jgi:transposase
LIFAIAESTEQEESKSPAQGIDLGDVSGHYCTLNPEGEIVDRDRFRNTLAGVERSFTDLPPVRIEMEAGTHSIWISQQLQEMGHAVIVANVSELRAISLLAERRWR